MNGNTESPTIVQEARSVTTMMLAHFQSSSYFTSWKIVNCSLLHEEEKKNWACRPPHLPVTCPKHPANWFQLGATWYSHLPDRCIGNVWRNLGLSYFGKGCALVTIPQSTEHWENYSFLFLDEKELSSLKFQSCWDGEMLIYLL